MPTTIQKICIFILSNVLAGGLMSPSHAIVATDGTGKTVFMDNFETAPEVATADGQNIDADPVAQTGTWNIGEVISIQQYQAFSASLPGNPQGNNYMRLRRYPDPDVWDSHITGYFSETVSGGSLHFSSMRYFDSASGGVTSSYLEYFKVLPPGSTGTFPNEPQLVRMFARGSVGSTTVTLRTEDKNGNTAPTGLSFKMDEWVRIDVDLDLDAQTYSVKVTDATGTDTSNNINIPFHTPGNEAAALAFIPTPAGIPGTPAALSYFDAVDESFPFDPGDFDVDGDVDGHDFLIWQRNPAVGSLQDWKDHYGNSLAVAAVTAVPEPGSLSLVALAFGSLLSTTGKRYSWYKTVA